MKKYLKLIWAASALLLLTGCNDDPVVPHFADDEIPYIYSEFIDYVNAYAGQPFELELFVVPSDGSVRCSWTMDDVEIATTATLSTTAPEVPGTYPLLFTAERNGQKNYRLFTLRVDAPLENNNP